VLTFFNVSDSLTQMDSSPHLQVELCSLPKSPENHVDLALPNRGFNSLAFLRMICISNTASFLVRFSAFIAWIAWLSGSDLTSLRIDFHLGDRTAIEPRISGNRLTRHY